MPYTLAVSKKVMPSSSARSMMRRHSASSATPPKCMVPRQMRLTDRLDRPRGWYVTAFAPSGIARVPRSPLDGSHGYPLDEEPLEEQEKYDDRQHDQCGRRHEQTEGHR